MNRFRKFISERRDSHESQRPSQQTLQSQQPADPPPEPVAQPVPERAQQVPISNVNIAEAAPGTLNIALQNQTTSSTVYAYITGRAIDRGNEWILVQSDARSFYYPTSPSGIMTPLQQDVAIPLGAPGNTVTINIPHIAGGRIWFSIGQKLTFFLNPGPALVEPSVTNLSDPNTNIEWGFCEFTFNPEQLYANISYVDFVSIPISLTLDTMNSGTSRVSGMNLDGLQQVTNGLRQQHAKDNVGWDQLIVNKPNSGDPLRVLSPNQGMIVHPSLFANYFEPYVEQVYQRFTDIPLRVDTQGSYGNLTGQVRVTATSNNQPVLSFTPDTQFAKPSTRDIFSCDTGPFVTGANAQLNAIIPRVSAAFNRTTLLVTDQLPADRSQYYQNGVTNHYSRLVHEANLDGKGYAFPYDDVQPSGGPDQSGEVHAGDPRLFTVAVGGSNAHA